SAHESTIINQTIKLKRTLMKDSMRTQNTISSDQSNLRDELQFNNCSSSRSCRPHLLLLGVIAWVALSPHLRSQTCEQGCDTDFNTFLGMLALVNDTTGGNNTGVGFGALSSNTSGSANTALGDGALTSTTSSSFNTACGAVALGSDVAGTWNSALGYG